MSATKEWRRCNACKEPIGQGALYYVCSVSTCNRTRTDLAFCSVSCWEVHLPIAKHRKAWAEERRAPHEHGGAAPSSASSPKKTGVRRIVREPSPAAPAAGSPAKGDASTEVLIIGSRLKDYVRAVSGFNTSDRVLEPLSEIVRQVCDEALRNAERDGRKTLLDRDIPDR